MQLTFVGEYRVFDVTALAQGWIDGSISSNGIMLSATEEDGPAQFGFHSREAPLCQPYIKIAYTTEGRPPLSDPTPACEPGTDTEKPKFEDPTVTPDPPIGGQPLAVKFEATDDQGLYRLELWRGGQLIAEVTDPNGPLELSISDPEATLDPGVYTYSAFAWDRSMNGRTMSYQIRVLHDGLPPKVQVTHHPLNPAIGETVTFQITAQDDAGVKHLTLGANNLIHDWRIDPAEESVTETLAYDEATLGYDPGDIRIIRYYASAGDEEHLYNSTGIKYVLFGNTGTDTDEDGLVDEIELLLGTDAENNDTDGDGLFDGWEVLGFDRDGDGIVDLDLPALGANPHQKDAFLEIDWMEDNTHTHRLHDSAVQAVVNAYRNYGLQLHVDTGAMGGGNALAHEAIADQWGWHAAKRQTDFDGNRWGIFYYATATHVGSKTACYSVDGEMRYCGAYMFLTTSDTGRYSKAARQAEQLMHELGHGMGLGHGGQRIIEPYAVSTLGKDGQVTTVNIDWAFDQENDKPNHLSNINYRYQWQLKACVNAEIDGESCHCMGHLEAEERDRRVNEGERLCDDVYLYSYHTTPASSLDESALNETAGFVAEAVLGAYVWRRLTDELELYRHWLQGTFYLRPHPPALEPLPATCPVNSTWLLANPDWVDWNLDGLESVTSYEWDVNQHCGNRDPCTDCEWSLDTLVARFEPSLLKPKIYGGGLTVAQAEPQHTFVIVASPEPNDPPLIATDGEYADGLDNDSDGRVDEGLPDSDGDGIVDPIDNCPLMYNANQFDTNRNHRGDACEVPPAAPSGLSVSVAERVAILSWSASPTTNIVGYNLYRRMQEQKDFARLGVSFPTTLADTSFPDIECRDGTIYTVSAVDLYMRESPLSEGVLLVDADDDGICDQIGARSPDPYQTDSNGDKEPISIWFFLLLLLIITLIVILVVWSLRRRVRTM